MILSEYAKARINNNKLKNVYSKYEPFQLGDIINIIPTDLTAGSHAIIETKCDFCESKNEMPYRQYVKITKIDGLYYCRKCAAVKVKNTCMKKYGVTNVSKSQTIIDKIKNVFLEKYGVDNIMNLEETRQKIKNVFLEKYGHNHPMKNKEFLKEFKRKNLEETGYETPFESDKVQKGIFSSGRKMKLHESLNLYYQGTYEKDFLDICKDLNIVVSKPKYIRYFFDGKTRRYFPDFYIEKLNLIIEVKSDYYYNMFLEMNKAKEKYVIDKGFNYIIIMNKNYDEFLKNIS